MNIGIFGGTFNPIHKGHLNLAKEVKRILKLDKVIFVPTYLPPHKSNKGIIPAGHRLKMVRLATHSAAGLSVSDVEIRRRGKSYTIDTLKVMKRKYRLSRLFFLIGSDSLEYLDGWKDLSEVFELADFVVVNRPGCPRRALPKGALWLRIKPLDISSRIIRELIRQGRPINKFVDVLVGQYIHKHNLYQ